MTKDEALKMCLEYIETDAHERKYVRHAIKKALANSEPWEKFCDSNCVWTDHHPDCKLAQRKPLTDEKLFKEWEENTSCDMPDTFEQFKHTARAIEAAHGIKG